MLVQDQYSGHIHDVPEPNGMAGLGEPVYDGLGNPVGFIGPILDTIRNVASNIPIVGGLVNSILPGGSSAPQPPGLPMPAIPSPPGFPSRFPFPFAPPRPFPAGWMRPPLPYTGLGPKRLYMRCAVWPGPRGLVPSFAANMPPGTQAPGAPGQPGFPPYPGMPYGGGGRRRRRRRR